MRIGHGYDVHEIAPGETLVLGGVEIPWDKGLVGHSDADVATHALMDALLSAARLPDIGVWFPNTDPTYRGASSVMLLARVTELVREAGFEVEDCDITLAAQAPKLAPYRDTMRKSLANAMGVSVERVGLKATTTEGLGFVGRGEGMEAWAVCLLREKG